MPLMENIFQSTKTNWNKLAASSLLQISASTSGGSHVVKMGFCIFSPIAQANQCIYSSRTPANHATEDLASCQLGPVMQMIHDYTKENNAIDS
jgi:hypothetical protein